MLYCALSLKCFVLFRSIENFFIFTVICEVTVKGYINDDILLPCNYSKASKLKEKTSVYWTDKDAKTLAKINRAGFSTEDNIYKDRVKNISQPFNTGIFDIVLKNAQPSDSNKYYCAIPSVHFRQTVVVEVSGLYDSRKVCN